ncbi:hypothetical protein evm_001154 [Chilo suppressalis]|nr:hypothetical protein evm_001154 [Chilo suppressalis]
MLLVAGDLYSVTGFGDGEILRGLQAENWRVPLEVFQADVISPRGESPLRLEPLDHSKLCSNYRISTPRDSFTRKPSYHTVQRRVPI